MKTRNLGEFLTIETQLRMIINIKSKMQADSFLTFSLTTNRLSTRRARAMQWLTHNVRGKICGIF
jgi:hypothetical protein